MRGDLIAIKRRIRAAMALAGLNIEALGQLIDQPGLRARTVRKLYDVNDEREPRKYELVAIAEATQVPLWFLTEGLDGAEGGAIPDRISDLEERVAQLVGVSDRLAILEESVSRLLDLAQSAAPPPPPPGALAHPPSDESRTASRPQRSSPRRAPGSR